MFAGAYAGSPAADKVKYGALNVTADVRGVAAARPYGDSFLLLAPGARLRATFAYYDTSTAAVRACLATCESYAHVLGAYAEPDLAAALAVGAGRGAAARGASSARCAQYKEVQVHGPVELARHVEALFGAFIIAVLSIS
jgi:hypothetical protein